MFALLCVAGHPPLSLGKRHLPWQRAPEALLGVTTMRRMTGMVMAMIMAAVKIIVAAVVAYCVLAAVGNNLRTPVSQHSQRAHSLDVAICLLTR